MKLFPQEQVEGVAMGLYVYYDTNFIYDNTVTFLLIQSFYLIHFFTTVGELWLSK